MTSLTKLDPLEEHFFIPSSIGGLKLFLRYLPARAAAVPRVAKSVLYVHGGTFPSALSIAHRLDGRSWRDELVAAGFDVWGLDFLGFGGSDAYPEMKQPAENKPALGQVDVAAAQLEQAVRFICEHQRVAALSIVAHSWGTIVTGLVAGRCPELIDRIVFFAPIVGREKQAAAEIFPAWRTVSLRDQWQRFTQDVPAGALPVLDRQDFDEWGELYLATDPESRTRSPTSVKTPSGPWQDIALAWAGRDAYDPAAIRAPVSVIRGEWDQASTDADAARLFEALKNSPIKRAVKISRATHLMHLEASRSALYLEAEIFLKGNDRPDRSPARPN